MGTPRSCYPGIRSRDGRPWKQVPGARNHRQCERGGAMAEIKHADRRFKARVLRTRDGAERTAVP